MNKVKQNLHTHTTYCDGCDTIEDIIKEAINRNFTSIGFSGHSYMYWSPDYSMSLDGTAEYKKEIAYFKEQYDGILDIFCGLEVDIFSEIDLSGYDYLIGSTHYLKREDGFIAFDRSLRDVKNVIDTHFCGKGIEYAKEYYKNLADMPKYGDFDIVGHFDLITKHRDNIEFFNENSGEYKKAAVSAAEALAGKIPYFEVNTGAIARGYRKNPYPSEYLLGVLKSLGFGAVISSDCHNKKMLDCEFETAEAILKRVGFKEKYILTKKGFVPIEL